MKIVSTELLEVKIIEPKVFVDERGYFLEAHQNIRYQDFLGEKWEFVQDNFSHSKKSVLRGLHFQSKSAQGKLVSVSHGEVFDVAVDIRKDSSSYGKWVGVYLSHENFKQLWIPPGFAHGFQVVSESANFHYKCTKYYSPHDEHCLLWDDPGVGIEWPIENPILSEKDSNGKLLSELIL